MSTKQEHDDRLHYVYPRPDRPPTILILHDGSTLRTALPSIPLMTAPVGADTSARAKSNLMRVEAWLDYLREHKLPLPADETHPDRLSLKLMSREAGVHRDCAADRDSEIRRRIDEAVGELGLAGVIMPPSPRTEPSLSEIAALARAAICSEGLETDTMIRGRLRDLDRTVTVLERREQGGAVSARVAIDKARVANDAGQLRNGTRHGPSLDLLGEVLSSVEAARPTAPDDGFLPDLASALTQIIGGTGLSIAGMAKAVGVGATALGRWMRSERVPDPGNVFVLDRICALAGVPSEILRSRILRRRAGSARIAEGRYPTELRGPDNRRLRSRIGPRLPELTGLDEATVHEIIHLAHADLLRETAAGRRQYERRRANLISALPERFVHELTLFIAWGRDADVAPLVRLRRRWSAVTAETYYDHLAMFGCCICGPDMPEDLRVAPEDLGLAHAVSPVLWSAFHAVRRSRLLPDERENRSIIDRLDLPRLLCEPLNGFLAQMPDLVVAVAQLPERLLPAPPSTPIDRQLLLCRLGLADLRATLRRQAAPSVSTAVKIAPILDRPDPMAIVGAIISHMQEQVAKLKAGSLSWAIAIRNLTLVHILAQTALRSGTCALLTVSGTAAHLLRDLEGGYRLAVPAAVFKPGAAIAAAGGFERSLANLAGCHRLLDLYLEEARPLILRGRHSDRLFVTSGSKGATMSAGILRNTVREITRRALSALAREGAMPMERGKKVVSLTAHNFRGILTTAVMKRSRSYTLAADAVCVTEATVRSHYARWMPHDREPDLYATLDAVYSEVEQGRAKG